jgi:hypothetical protein
MLLPTHLDYINAPNGHVDALSAKDLDMDACFNFDDYAAHEKAESAGQHDEHGDFSNDRVDAKSESNSELSEDSNISALNPDHPANEYLGSCVTPKASHYMRGQDQLGRAGYSPFAHVQSQEKDFDNDFAIRQATRKRRTME